VTRATFSLIAAAVTLGGLLAVVVVAGFVRRAVPAAAARLGIALLAGYAAVLVLRPPGWPVIDIAVVGGAAGGVLLLEGGLRSPGAVAAFLVVAALVDVASMSGGLTRVLIDRHRSGASDLLLYLTLVVPIGGRPVPIVGIGDLLVGGTAALALVRLGLRPAAVAVALAAGLGGALAYGLWRGGAPAVPFIAAAVLALVAWSRHGVARGRASRS
jgi:hypothetical protein